MSEEVPVHPSAIEVAENGVAVVRDVGTRVEWSAVPGVPSEPSKTEDKEEEGEKEDKAA
jgi:hypothetical protein